MVLAPSILVVANEHTASEIRGWLHRAARLRCATTFAQGLEELDGSEGGLAFDDSLSPGDLTILIRRARDLNPRVRIAGLEREEKHPASPTFPTVPLSQPGLLAFVAAVADFERARALRLARRIEKTALTLGLTSAETRILELMTHGVPRRRLAASTDTTEETVKSHVRQILLKSGRAAVADLVIAILRHAID